MVIVKQNLRYFGIIKGVFLFDIITKFAITFFMNHGDVIQFGSFLDIVYVLNTGVSFGFLAGISYGKWIITALTMCILAMLFVTMLKEQRRYMKYNYALVIGGALGNIVDRVIHGGVVDFLYFHIGQYYYPAFNVADSSICIGVFFMLTYGFFANRWKKLNEAADEYERSNPDGK